VDSTAIIDGRVDVSRIRPLGRLAGSGYVTPGEFFQLVRPTYAGLVATGNVHLNGEKTRA
jgi:hypothetical protein